MKRKKTITALIIGGLLIAATGALFWKTVNGLQPLPVSLNFETGNIRKVQILDRNSIPLTVTYQNRWNIHDHMPLHDIPPLLQHAFVMSEDRRFYQHHGVDWRARLMALFQNISSFRAVRGASTITEQVVRMWRPRPRTLWSRWLEGFEAARLEKPILHLARKMLHEKLIPRAGFDHLQRYPLKSRKASLTIKAEHFVHHLYGTTPPYRLARLNHLRTTLSAPLQQEIQAILNQRLGDLKSKGVHNGAVLVVNHQKSEALAWVNGGKSKDGVAESWIDAITTPRQPGSTLKPFLYALALEKGWTAATLVDDLPLAAPVGHGLHTYHNYSRIHYGPLPLRHAPGNSLNTPAVRTIQFVEVNAFLNCFKRLGIHSLHQHPDHYGEGLALGNGEISLLELVGAYTVLENRGVYRPLQTIMDEENRKHGEGRVFTPETTSIIGSILSDPGARTLEFGQGSLLRFPVQTAIKTGTSSDYRDAWAVGYNDRFTVGVWVGNLNHQATFGVTGATGPALILRSVFAELNRNRQTRPLFVSPQLTRREICRETSLPADGRCITVSEWFAPGTEPESRPTPQPAHRHPYLQRPSHGLQLAMDPRIPDHHEAFQFQMANLPENSRVNWYVDGKHAATTSSRNFLWPLSKGPHRAMARVWISGINSPMETNRVNFMVK